MSMRVEILKDPCGLYPKPVKVGDILWIERSIAIKLLNNGLAILRGPDYKKSEFVKPESLKDRPLKEDEQPDWSDPPKPEVKRRGRKSNVAK